MNSGVSVGIHHIFFPPRLEVVSVEVVHDGDRGDGLHFLVFDHTLCQEFERPVVGAIGRSGAGCGDEVVFTFLTQFLGLTGARVFCEGMRKAARTKSVAHALDDKATDPQTVCAGILAHSFMGQEESVRSGNDPCLVRSLTYDIVEMLPIPLGEFNDVLGGVFHIPPSIS
jgi:hypothetical protein